MSTSMPASPSGKRTRRFTEAEKAEIIRRYVAGENSYQLAEAFGSWPSAIQYHLRKAKAVRTAREFRLRRTLREDAFENAERDADAAYWVGFLMADGWVHTDAKRRSYLLISLSVRDCAHVESLQRFLGSNHMVSVEEKESGDVVHLAINSPRIVQALARYGIVPRKSLVAEARLLENDPAFWRGVIDGDGTVRWHRRGALLPPLPHISLVGSQRLVEQFRAFARSVSPAWKTRVVRRPGKAALYRCAATGRPALPLIRVLYEGHSMALARKSALADELLKWVPHH